MNKNKGFSLVELIVVVAIMAVLVGILAPAYLSYVEKTRRGTDEDMAEEVRHTIEIATAEINVYDELSGGCTVIFTPNCALDSATGYTCNAASHTNFDAAMADVYSGKTFELKSKLYKAKQNYTVTIQAAAGTGAALVVTGAWN